MSEEETIRKDDEDGAKGRKREGMEGGGLEEGE